MTTGQILFIPPISYIMVPENQLMPYKLLLNTFATVWGVISLSLNSSGSLPAREGSTALGVMECICVNLCTYTVSFRVGSAAGVRITTIQLNSVGDEL